MGTSYFHLGYTQNKFFFIKKWAFPGLFLFIFVLSANKQYDFYIKSMWKNVLPVSGTGIRTHGFEYMSLLHLTTWPGLPPNYIKVLP